MGPAKASVHISRAADSDGIWLPGLSFRLCCWLSHPVHQDLFLSQLWLDSLRGTTRARPKKTLPRRMHMFRPQHGNDCSSCFHVGSWRLNQMDLFSERQHYKNNKNTYLSLIFSGFTTYHCKMGYSTLAGNHYLIKFCWSSFVFVEHSVADKVSMGEIFVACFPSPMSLWPKLSKQQAKRYFCLIICSEHNSADMI